MRYASVLLALLVTILHSSLDAEEYRFVVMGDNRHDRPVVMPETYERIIEEVNLLRPDFVVLCGDLILGYTDDDSLVREEWREFKKVTGRLQMPYHLVVGNHDVWDESSQIIYREECGDLYYSFDHKSSGFLMIDTDVVGETDYITGDQLDWLERELAKRRRAEHIFVFMHKPLWTFEGEPGRAWKEEVHPLLLRYGVDDVFAGHDHAYYVDYRDGIRYVVSGGAGAPIGEYPESGDFHHYLLCTVEDDATTIAVIKPGSISSEDVVLYGDVEKHRKIRSECVSFPYLDLPVIGKREFTLIVANPFSASIQGKLKWRLEDSKGWQIEPGEREFTVFPGCQLGLKFRAATPPEAWYPTPTVDVLYSFAENKDAVRVDRDIRLVPKYDCRKIELPTATDGELTEWTGIETIEFSERSQIASRESIEWRGIGDKSGDVGFSWDEEYLYFCAKVVDDSVHRIEKAEMLSESDCVILCFDVGDDPRGAGHLDEFLTVYFFGQTEEGGNVHRWWVSSAEEVCSVEEIKCVVKKTVRGESYEARIPWEALKSDFVPGKGTVIGLDVVVPDNDGEGRKGWFQWTPGIMERGDTSYFGKLCLR